MKFIVAAFLSILFILPNTAHAETGCTLVLSYPDSKVLYQDGDCTTRRSPASTFKIALALMGYDAHILHDAHSPSLPYKDEYNGMEGQKKITDPTIWEKDSIVWYSQQLTQKLGAEKFQKYVDQFDYGNRDLGGNPGKNDGLTQAWLFTSLSISPMEETTFLTKFLNRNLGVSAHAYDTTAEIIPIFRTGKWVLHGKTGSGQIDNDPHKPQGWFVGWGDNGAQKIVFAKLILPPEPTNKAGPKARDEFLKELPALLP